MYFNLCRVVWVGVYTCCLRYLLRLSDLAGCYFPHRVQSVLCTGWLLTPGLAGDALSCSPYEQVEAFGGLPDALVCCCFTTNFYSQERESKVPGGVQVVHWGCVVLVGMVWRRPHLAACTPLPGTGKWM